MAAYISFQPSDYMNTLLYTGTGATGNAVSGAGFTPDIVWVKKRSGSDGHNYFDTVRGATKYLTPNDSAAEATGTNTLESFNADGFTVGLAGTVGQSGYTYAGWCWKAGTTSSLSGGTITPSSQTYNTTAGISAVEYVGDGAATSATVPHGLGVAPTFCIFKSTSSADHWFVGNIGMGTSATNGFDYYQQLNNTMARSNNAGIWNDTIPTSTLVTLGNADGTDSGKTYMLYSFAPKRGFSKFNYYEGNGNADGPFVNCGFRPAWLMVKRTDTTSSWTMIDCRRTPINDGTAEALWANDGAAEGSYATVDFLSNGFKIRDTSSTINNSGSRIIYAAFAEFPLVSSNSKAGNAK